MPRTEPTELIVPPTLAGERLDRAMARLVPDLSRGEARRLIAAGVVFVAGKRTGISSRQVREGEQIHWEAPARPRPPGRTGEPRIVDEQPSHWIVDKPAGMPTEATRAGSVGTLADWLRKNRGTAFITHRLDAATSGLVVVARDRDAQAGLNRLFATHAIGRRYLAVISPCPDWNAQIFENPIEGRPAITHVEVAARSQLAAAVVVDLGTGRSHQIRRHLAEAGFPVIGETAAGRRTNARLLLHAFEVRLPAGEARPPIVATAPPPPDFIAAASVLGLELPALLTGEGRVAKGSDPGR